MPTGIYERTDEMKKTMSVSLRGNVNARGVRSEEFRVKDSIGLMGNKNAWKHGAQTTNAKDCARRRSLGFIPLNSWFEGCEGHHVDPEQVIFLPKELHRSIRHRQTDGQGMAQINAIAYNYLFKQEVMGS